MDAAPLHELIVELTSRAWVSDAWLHGSLATGHHHAGVSDIDVVAIATRVLGPSDVRELQHLHQRLDVTWPASSLGCTYVDEGQIDDRTALHPTWTHGQLVWRRLSPMVRAELLDHGQVLVGRSPAAVLASMTSDDVKDAARQELAGYWSWAVRRPWLFLRPEMADLALLSMARARITLSSGILTSKDEATARIRAPQRVVDGVRRRRTGGARTVPVAPILAHHAWHDTRRTIAEHAQER